MDTQRLILVVIFAFSLLMLWETWQKQHQPVQGAATATAPAGIPGAASAGAPSGTVPGTVPAPTAGNAAVPASAQPAPVAPREHIKVQTDVLNADIDTLGGNIDQLELLNYPGIEASDNNLVLKAGCFLIRWGCPTQEGPVGNLMLLGSEHQYEAQSGLTGEGMPNHKTLYRASVKEAILAPGADSVEVRLEADGTGPAAGVKVTKILRFHRGSFLIDVSQEVKNGGANPLAANAYFQLTRDDRAPGGDPRMVNTYTGPALYSDKDKFQKIGFSDVEKGVPERTEDDGWVAMLQHYFTSAIIPPQNKPRTVYMEKLDGDQYRVGVKLPAAVPPGGTASLAVGLYAGPEDQDRLKAIAPGLERTVDYGKLTIIAQPLFSVLRFFHGLTGNWGIAIILLTVSIKLVFFPLSAASYRSMAKMKLVAPAMTKIREQYADDRVKQNQAMMELYKQEKINPLGGCLPIVVQIPVFISLYWTLLESVELRHAPFYGWIHDLASSDPYRVLPALMMVSMILQTKLNPTPPDPVQAKVMMIMPLVFGAMFFLFPAGLVLYWLVNNILSILQQWQITRMLGPKATKPAA